MIRITRKELALVIEAANRKARRTGKHFVVRWSRIIIVEELLKSPLTERGRIESALERIRQALAVNN